MRVPRADGYFELKEFCNENCILSTCYTLNMWNCCSFSCQFINFRFSLSECIQQQQQCRCCVHIYTFACSYAPLQTPICIWRFIYSIDRTIGNDNNYEYEYNLIWWIYYLCIIDYVIHAKFIIHLFCIKNSKKKTFMILIWKRRVFSIVATRQNRIHYKLLITQILVRIYSLA